MNKTVKMIKESVNRLAGNADKLVNALYGGGMREDVVSEVDKENRTGSCPTPTVRISSEVLDEFRKTVGLYPAETGGMIACRGKAELVDIWHFDKTSKNTSTSYSYDVEETTAVSKEWKDKGYICAGFVHSHPESVRRPSYDDIATAMVLMDYFQNDFFYMPIIMSERNGLFTLYFYVLCGVDEKVHVELDHVLQAEPKGYILRPFRRWGKNYARKDLEAYYKRVNAAPQTPDTTAEKELNAIPSSVPVSAYFQRLSGMYPEHVLDKVIVCIGTGGARTLLENMARNGFRNFILMDGDTIAPSNIATQGCFISEMGMNKTDAIRRRICDINPLANVLCVNRFLNDDMSDEMFKSYLDQFPGRKATDYLILGCTDSFEANKRSSLLSLKYGIPYIGAGMYRRGLAAEVVFTYPGVTSSCPRCLLRSRFEAYEAGYTNDVTSEGCPSFATERLNTLIGYVSLMMLMYREAPESPYNEMLEEVKDRNFLWIRLTPHLNSSELGIGLFDKVFSDPTVSRYTFMDETLWIPQHPDSPENGEEVCKLCGGIGDLRRLRDIWPDTRLICFNQQDGDILADRVSRTS